MVVFLQSRSSVLCLVLWVCVYCVCVVYVLCVCVVYVLCVCVCVEFCVVLFKGPKHKIAISLKPNPTILVKFKESVETASPKMQ
jgi:hypothetical protein